MKRKPEKLDIDKFALASVDLNKLSDTVKNNVVEVRKFGCKFEASKFSEQYDITDFVRKIHFHDKLKN